jgi:hypothetical protein
MDGMKGKESKSRQGSSIQMFQAITTTIPNDDDDDDDHSRLF